MFRSLGDCSVPAEHLVYQQVSHSDFVTAWRPLPAPRPIGRDANPGSSPLPTHVTRVGASRAARSMPPDCAGAEGDRVLGDMQASPEGRCGRGGEADGSSEAEAAPAGAGAGRSSDAGDLPDFAQDLVAVLTGRAQLS